MQAVLLDKNSISSTIDAAFQQQLAVVVEPQWKYFAPYISPSSLPGAENEVPVINMLQQWRERMHPTFGDVSEILSHLYIEPPIPLSALKDIKQQLIVTSGRHHEGMYIYYLCVHHISYVCAFIYYVYWYMDVRI